MTEPHDHSWYDPDGDLCCELCGVVIHDLPPIQREQEYARWIKAATKKEHTMAGPRELTREQVEDRIRYVTGHVSHRSSPDVLYLESISDHDDAQRQRLTALERINKNMIDDELECEQVILNAGFTEYDLHGEYKSLLVVLKELVEKYQTAQATIQALNEKYHQLLYAVGNKYAGESRHETALRYIRERELNYGVGKAALAGESHG